jgi:osmotically inducible protein OsmC
MTNVLYTAEAHVAGGRREGHGRSSDGELDVQLRTPGTGGGTNPEQLFAVGYAACYESALRSLARLQKIQVGNVSIDAEVDLWTADDSQFDIAVRLNVNLPDVEDQAVGVELARAAHERCPYSRATRGNIEVSITANGTAIT